MSCQKQLAYPRICVSSTCGGGGKTLLSLGLCRAFRKNGHEIKPFKKGPDYIDAAWLAAAAGAPATCLDPFFMNDQDLRELFCKSMAESEVALIEGNRGLFDGLNESGICSTSHVCRILQCPVLLCVDCAKSTRTMAAILNGLVNFEPGLQFAGVILNRTGSSRHESSLTAAIDANTDLKILGILPRLEKQVLPERHMGIASFGPQLDESMEQTLDFLAQYVASNCDLDAILDCARETPALSAFTGPDEISEPESCAIGVVRDEALWFYYPENLAALEKAGARLVFLSLLENSAENCANWQKIDGLYLGGGFPEDLPGQISASPYLELIREYAAQGMPVYAECGGLIILCKSLAKDGRVWPMANVFPCSATWQSRPQGLGYVEATVRASNPWHKAGQKLRGHEFHYSACTWEKEPLNTALALSRGAGIYTNEVGESFDALLKNNVWASYTHIFAPANPDWAKNFVSLAVAHGAKTGLSAP